MDSRKSIEDQFSKLHPSLPVSTRIGIVGGGPSGLSAAYALAKLGYSNVTVLEKYQTVGGMCESAEIEGTNWLWIYFLSSFLCHLLELHVYNTFLAGNIYDLGGQVLAANSAPVIFHWAKEIGSELEEMDSHKLTLIDSSTGKHKDIKVADDYVSVISLTLELQVSF